MLKTPILFLIFNRPDTTLRVFEKIKKARPHKLFVAGDGPRNWKPGEDALCREAREIATKVDWPCEIKTLFRDQNLGCKNAVKEGIDWFFENVEEGIILEDDCVPDETFFLFSQMMLEQFKSEKHIFQISGVNYLDPGIANSAYFFSNIIPIWGWATWRDRWEKMDLSMKNLNDLIGSGILQKRFPNNVYTTWLINLFKEVITNRLNSWATQWTYTVIANNGICVMPGNNLINNIGSDGTHAFNKSLVNFRKTKPVSLFLKKIEPIEVNPILELKQLEFLKRNINNDNKIHLIDRLKLSVSYRIGLFKHFVLSRFLNSANILLRKKGYLIAKHSHSKVIRNVFNKNYQKRAILCYLTKPFKEKDDFSHTNYRESLIFAKVLDSLDYIVDVIDYDTFYSELDFKFYDLILGQGETLEQSILNKVSIKKIVYCPGWFHTYNNQENLRALMYFHTRNNDIFPEELRLVNQNWLMQYQYSDHFIVLGNKLVKDSYVNSGILPSRISNINIFYTNIGYIDLTKKEFSQTQKRFLWFGGSGAIKKGLDIAIEYFEKHKNYELVICGHLSQPFYNHYKDILESSGNITYKSFVDIRSNEFKEILMSCTALIFPSICEGGAASVLTVLASGGLIPIITRTCGLSLDEYAVYVEDLTFESIDAAIKNYINIPLNEHFLISQNILNHVRKNYTEEAFENNIFEIIKGIE